MDSDEENENQQFSLHTKATDIWSFGMLVYACYHILFHVLVLCTYVTQEIMTEKVPYFRFPSFLEVVVITVILKKILPEEPVAMSDGLRALWGICMKCWAHIPEQRATIRDDIKDLSQIDLAIQERAEVRTARSTCFAIHGP